MASRLVTQGGAKLRKAKEEDPATTTPPQVTDLGNGTAGESANTQASVSAIIPASGNAGDSASVSAGENTGRKTGSRTQRKKIPAVVPVRRVGRPRGPDRIAITVRILPATDSRLTAAVEKTGESPQYIVEAALDAYLTRLGIPRTTR